MKVSDKKELENPVEHILDELVTRQNERMRSIKGHAITIRDLMDKLIKKIDDQGLRGYYSVNHDSLVRVRRLHKDCMELSQLRGCRTILESYLKRINEDE